MQVNIFREKIRGYSLNSIVVAALCILLISLLSQTGPSSFGILVLILFTIVALKYPIVIPAAALLLSPMFGRNDSSIFGGIGGTEIIAIWLFILGGFLVLLNWSKFVKERLLVILVLLILTSLFSVTVSAEKTRSLVEVIRMTASFVMLPLVMLLARGVKERKFIVYSIILSALVPLSVGIYQAITGDVSYEFTQGISIVEQGLLRIYATFWDVHPFAKYLMLLLPLLGLLFLAERRHLFYKVALAYLFVLAFVELIYTYARSELIGLFVAIAGIVYAKGKITIRLFASFLFVIIVLIAVFYVTGVFTRFADLFQSIDFSTPQRENTIESRLIIWLKGFPLALQSPFRGHGADMFERAVGIVSHNDYLGLFYDLGLAGPILYSLFLLVAFKKTVKLSRSSGLTALDRSIMLTAAGGTAAIAVVSIAENLFKATVMWWFYFAIVGCALASVSEERSPGGGIDKSVNVTSY